MNGWQTSEQCIPCGGKNNLYAVTVPFGSQWEYRGAEVTSRPRNSQAERLVWCASRKRKGGTPRKVSLGLIKRQT